MNTRNLKVIGIIVLAIVAVLAIGRWTAQPEAPEPFERVKFIPQANGSVWAEAWIEVPGSDYRLEVDHDQNVVALIGPHERMALPDRVKYGLLGQQVTASPITPVIKEPVPSPDSAGYVQVSLYHLVLQGTEKEIGYYKRKFARFP